MVKLLRKLAKILVLALAQSVKIVASATDSNSGLSAKLVALVPVCHSYFRRFCPPCYSDLSGSR